VGSPRLVGAAYYVLGPDAGGRGAAYIRDYYAFMGPATEYLIQGLLTTPEAVKDAMTGFSDVGVDELIFWPTVPDLDQVDQLTAIVG
jgi:hypothetical protein